MDVDESAGDLMEADVASAMLQFITSNKDCWTLSTSQEFIESYVKSLSKQMTASRLWLL